MRHSPVLELTRGQPPMELLQSKWRYGELEVLVGEILHQVVMEPAEVEAVLMPDSILIQLFQETLIHIMLV